MKTLPIVSTRWNKFWSFTEKDKYPLYLTIWGHNKINKICFCNERNNVPISGNKPVLIKCQAISHWCRYPRILSIRRQRFTIRGRRSWRCGLQRAVRTAPFSFTFFCGLNIICPARWGFNSLWHGCYNLFSQMYHLMLRIFWVTCCIEIRADNYCSVISFQRLLIHLAWYMYYKNTTGYRHIYISCSLWTRACSWIWLNTPSCILNKTGYSRKNLQVQGEIVFKHKKKMVENWVLRNFNTISFSL